MTDTTFTWGCEKWADCSCCTSKDKCGCGTACGCGTVSVDDVNDAVTTHCDKADCTCGMACRCGKGNCDGGGSTVKTQEQWIEYTKSLKETTTTACANCATDADGKCICTSTCSCAPQQA